MKVYGKAAYVRLVDSNCTDSTASGCVQIMYFGFVHSWIIP